jgi:transposase
VANVLKMAMIQAILQLHSTGLSCRAIARQLGVDRGSVAKVIESSRAAPKPAKAPSGSEEPKPASLAGSPGPAPLGAHPQREPAHEDTDERSSKPAKAPSGSDHGICVTTGTTGPTQSMGLPHEGSSGRSVCEPFRQIIEAKLREELSAQRIFQDLVSDQQYTGSYYSVRRFVQKLTARIPLPMRRMECVAGFEAQVDYGTVASLVQPDGRRRKTHVFRIVLSHSRKGYSEACFRQTTDEFLRCLENSFWAFGGVPQTVVIDNLKAGVIHPDWYDPELNPKLRDFCAHYGTVILPTKSYTPRHKGKIERGIGYVKGNSLRARTFASLNEQNEHLAHWERTIADTRIHGTTRRHVGQMFQEIERPALRLLPSERFPLFEEAQRKVSRDGHVEVKRSYYSVPPEYLGRTVWARWDARLVRIFNEKMTQIAIHVRHEPGRFSTQSKHLAPEKINSIERGVDWLLGKVSLIGPQSIAWAQAMLCARGIEGTRVLQGLIALTTRHSSNALEKACKTALFSGEFRLRTIRKLAARPSPMVQAELPFLDEHPLIRPLDDYAQLVAEALARKPESPEPSGAAASHRELRFERHDWANEYSGQERENPGGGDRQGVRDIHPPRSGYPSSGCSPAEPESVSPDGSRVVPLFPPLPGESSDE